MQKASILVSVVQLLRLLFLQSNDMQPVKLASDLLGQQKWSHWGYLIAFVSCASQPQIVVFLFEEEISSTFKSFVTSISKFQIISRLRVFLFKICSRLSTTSELLKMLQNCFRFFWVLQNIVFLVNNIYMAYFFFFFFYLNLTLYKLRLPQYYYIPLFWAFWILGY